MGSASEIIAKLNLAAHPKGGFYSETFRDNSIVLSKSQLPPQYKVERAVSSCVYFLLQCLDWWLHSGFIKHFLADVDNEGRLHGVRSKSAIKAKRRKANMGSASEIVAKLNLAAHPEGGFYSETFRDNSIVLSKSQLPPQYKVERAVSSCIYFLLPSGNVSSLHRIPCAETWHFYVGEPITVVELNDKDGQVKLTCLGPNLLDNQQPQYTVPSNVWFGSFPTKDISISPDGTVLKAPPRDSETHFSLVGCTCAPAFQFQDFELAKRSELVSLFPNSEALISLLTFPE